MWNPSKFYFCIWENFSAQAINSPDMRNCLNGWKWVGSLIMESLLKAKTKGSEPQTS